jgi:hypothetical protein
VTAGAPLEQRQVSPNRWQVFNTGKKQTQESFNEKIIKMIKIKKI